MLIICGIVLKWMLLSIKQKMISVNLPNLPVGKERLDEVLPDEVCSLGV